MLVRAARRKSRPSAHLIRPVPSSDLYLPWLCPALGNRKAQSRWSSEDSNQHGLSLGKRRTPRESQVHIHSRRSLATHISADMRELDVQWDYASLARLPQAVLGEPLAEPKVEPNNFLPKLDFDVNEVLQVNDACIMPPQRVRVFNGVGGDIEEMYAVLQGCLIIGRMKRAEAIIKRLSAMDIPEGEIVDIKKEFVRISVNRIVSNPSNSATQALHSWFELQIRGKHDLSDHDVLAYMLKASLRESSEKKRDRLVRRYMDLRSDVPEDSQSDNNETVILSKKEQELIDSIYAGFKPDVRLDEPYEQQEEEEGEVLKETAVSTGASKGAPYVEVIPTQQKGLGLSSLKQSLAVFTEQVAGFDPSTLTYEQQKQRQIRLETDAVSSAIDRWRRENAKMTKMGLNTAMQTKNVGSRMWKWQVALEVYIKNELERIESFEAAGSKLGDEYDLENTAVWLRLLPPEHLAAITILTVMNRLSITGVDTGIPLAGLVVFVGKSVEDEFIASQIKKAVKENPTFANKKKEEHLLKLLKKGRPTSKRSVADSETIPSFPQYSSDDRWPIGVAAKVGAFLCEGLFKTATLPVTRVNPVTEEVMTQIQPAFSRVQQTKLGKKIGVLLANSTLVEQLRREPVHSLLAKHLPMIVEPAPWTKFNTGGFFAHAVKMIRVKNNDKDQRHYADVAIERGDMEPVMRGLDVLGKQSWVINKVVLDVMIEAWNSGEKLANLPAAEPDIKFPEPPAADADPLERDAYHKACKLVANERGALHSQRCYQNFQIEIARSLRDEKIYFPHNVDFRGRAYPIPPLFNHMGADHCRGLLLFGEKRELGEGGLKWLKIHLANVYGFDKASLSERERFADDHREDIYDSATNSLGGRRWWLDAEDPWQTLAACIELKNAWDSPDPAKFMSSLAVHQDGTCNGLQHYAALGGDEWGARQVNLEPGDRPSDIYTAVADLVKDGLEKDIEAGDPCAQFLEGKITRKLVKQSVMTNVYGVTWIGARAQIRRQLLLAHKETMPNAKQFNSQHIAGYIATKIFRSLSKMFGGAHDIQHWLGECANRISLSLTSTQVERLVREYDAMLMMAEEGSEVKIKRLDADLLTQFRSPVIWTTPLKMPVVQPYRTTKARLVKTCLSQVNLVEPHRSDPVCKRKQLQAFPPNFVHSLDATHMMLSALKCSELGLNFAAVHDSFWTHACDIDKMNGVLRDAFVRIHSEDVMGRLAAEFDVRYAGCYQVVKVKGGTKVVSMVGALRKSKEWKDLKKEMLGPSKYSRKIFDISRVDVQAQELIVEKKVAEMLGSDDPEVVARAQKMKTPGRILQEFGAEGDFEAPPELAEIGIGDIPGDDTNPKVDNEVAAEAVESDQDLMSDSPADEDLVPDNSVNDQMADTTPDETDEAGDKPGSPMGNHWFERKATGQRVRDKPKISPPKAGEATWAWIPLKLPPVPKRGDYDVSRLKGSDYFFS